MDYKTPDHSTFHRFPQRLIGFEEQHRIYPGVMMENAAIVIELSEEKI